MKEIKLTQNKVALVDDELYEWLNQWKWYAHKVGNTYYATRHIKGTNRMIRMHHQILNIAPGKEVDHRNRNGLDNRCSNIRECTHSQNQANRRGGKNSKSKYKGVKSHPETKKWRASICDKHLGYFNTEEEAARAYDKASIEKYGEYARLNIPEKSGQLALFKEGNK